MTKMTDLDPLMKCAICENTWAWHQANKPQHAFMAEGEGGRLVPVSEIEQPQAKGDLILRLALVKAGVITDADLNEAEQQVNKARELGRVLMLEPDAEGVLQWRLLSMDELRAALGNMVVT